jgi:hypothetical protein
MSKTIPFLSPMGDSFFTRLRVQCSLSNSVSTYAILQILEEHDVRFQLTSSIIVARR